MPDWVNEQEPALLETVPEHFEVEPSFTSYDFPLQLLALIAAEIPQGLPVPGVRVKVAVQPAGGVVDTTHFVPSQIVPEGQAQALFTQIFPPEHFELS